MCWCVFFDGGQLMEIGKISGQVQLFSDGFLIVLEKTSARKRF